MTQTLGGGGRGMGIGSAVARAPRRSLAGGARAAAALLSAALVLAGCGGGGTDAGRPLVGSGTDAGSSGGVVSSGELVVGGDGSGLLPSSASLAQQCAADNPLAAPALRTATLATEMRWLRAYLDEAYLWFDEVPAIDPAVARSLAVDATTQLDTYFQWLLTPTVEPSGRRRDRFSFTLPTAQWQSLSQDAVAAGFGAEWTFGSQTPPRDIRIAFVDPATPAAAAGLGRGWTLVSVDGVSADDTTSSGIDRLNEALVSPREGVAYAFVLRTTAGAERSVTLTAGAVTKTPVQNLRTWNVDGGTVGYLSFHDHLAPAEGQLLAAFTELAARGVGDLVLDLRYNGGGFLYIASQVAAMVSSAARTDGRPFERLIYSRKRQAESDDPANTAPFYDTTSGLAGSGTTAGQPLPRLNLSRLYVLAGQGTCSASESIVNGLRGVGVQVVLIGDTTCGKPYGFTARDNCGLSYFPIEFRGVNALGLGDYADGFAPTCAVADDFDHALGDEAEGRLAAALFHRRTGQCPPAAAAAAPNRERVLRHPAREIRVLRPAAR